MVRGAADVLRSYPSTALRRAACLLLVATAVAVAASPLSPAASRPRTAVFKATLAASVSTALEFSGREAREGCTYETTGDASGSFALASERPATISSRRARRTGRISFSATLHDLTATVVLSGAVTRTSGLDCVADAGVVCDPPPRSRVRNVSARFSMRRNGTIVFEPLDHDSVRRTIGGCAGPDTRLGDLGLASGRVAPRKLFDPRVRTIVVRGSRHTETPLQVTGLQATAEHTVRWTLTLRRQRAGR